MKTKKLYLILIASILMIACKKDDPIEPIVSEEQVEPETIEPETIEPENGKPSIPTLTFPEQNQELVSLLPMLDWQESIDPDADPISYNLFLGTTGSSLNLIASNLTTTDFVVNDALQKGTSYEWRVDALDDKGNTNASEVFSFETEFSIITQLSENGPFAKRKNASLTVFKNKIWLIGGKDEAGNVLSDIWSSEDGENWNLETDNASFGPRNGHVVVEFQNKLWLYNGSTGVFLNQEIWSSADGLNWIRETNDHPWDIAPFYGQNSIAMFVFGNKIWRFAAYHGSTEELSTERNVWNSVDGKNWVLVTENHGFDRKFGMKVIPFQGKLIAFEGYASGANSTNKIRQSLNAIDWEVVTETLPFNIGTYSDAVVHNEKLFLTGGTNYNELWFTNDGIEWNKAVNQRNYPVKTRNSSVVFNNRIFIIGASVSGASNDIWVID